MLPVEGELAWYDRAGWVHPSTFRATPRWLRITTEDGEVMCFEREDLEIALGFRPGGLLGTDDDPRVA